MAKKDKKKKRKKGIFENPLAGKPVQDPNLPDFNVEGSFNQKGYNVRDYGFKIESQNLDNLQVSYDGGKRTANIDRKTLEKGGATLIGMAPQENRQGQRVQGFNYGNLNYINAVQNNKELQEAKRYYGVGSVGVDKRTQFANNQKKVDAILKSREAIASLPEHLKTDKIVSSIQNKSNEQTEQSKANQNRINSRLKKISAMRTSAQISAMQSNPNLGTANKIRRNLGLKEIFAHTRRRRRGRWDAQWAVSSLKRSKSSYYQTQVEDVESPEQFLTEYYRKQNIVDWGKTQGLELSDTDTGKFRTGAIAKPSYWTHNNRKRRVGTSEVTQYRTGKPLNEDQETIVLYNKLMNESAKKKTKYENYYNTDPDVEVYNYYSITDEDFNKLDEYKTSLVTNIRETEDAKYDLQNRIIGCIFV